MLLQELLIEHVQNVFNSDAKRSLLKTIEPMIQKTYSDLGRNAGVLNHDNLSTTPGIWKIVRKNGEIQAGILYRTSFGNKIRLMFQNGTSAGKDALKKLIIDDMKQHRAWVEVSGPLERYMTKIGAAKVPAKFASKLLGEPISDFDADEFHYTREAGGTTKKMIIMGDPKGI